ncbi:MAG: Thiamin-phosphate pyrophosphorylase, partial [uncultured Acetobacteraceae bacterium]
WPGFRTRPIPPPRRRKARGSGLAGSDRRREGAPPGASSRI